jgi:hypothetical protein
LPPTDSAPLADYLSYLNLLRELLRHQADQILPHPSECPVTPSVKPENLVLLKDIQLSPLVPQWIGSHLVILTMPTTVKAQQDPLVAATFKDKTLPTNFRLFHYKKG